MSTSDVRPENMPTGKVVKSSWKGSDLPPQKHGRLVQYMWGVVSFVGPSRRCHGTAQGVSFRGRGRGLYCPSYHRLNHYQLPCVAMLFTRHATTTTAVHGGRLGARARIQVAVLAETFSAGSCSLTRIRPNICPVFPKLFVAYLGAMSLSIGCHCTFRFLQK